MSPLESAIVAALPLSAVVLTVLARYYGWDSQEILRKQWTLLEVLFALLIVGGSIALGVLIGGVLGAFVAAGFLSYTLAFLAVYYRRG
ncbi:hypothetical protein [Halalkalicoccus tibetensis]|uniref:Uncharacterized protein n=1 Tax=Halalkalicoccus tibetensis TaxID=175632 RepID=A0ABD5V326_9EURY